MPERKTETEAEERSIAINSPSSLSGFDIDLFKAGKHFRIYEKLGAHVVDNRNERGIMFRVWAPNARYVSLIGNFNGWQRDSHPMSLRWDGSGIWEFFVEGLSQGEYYKYYIESNKGYAVEKADPYGFHFETSPATASVSWQLGYDWNDEKWLQERRAWKAESRPLSVYELHLGSWRRVVEEGGRFLSYRELAAELPAYCKYMRFTHVELLPVTEHPFYGSWGYQATGYYAPTSRYGTPQDFMFLVDELHNAGIGVILDWVPSHFPTDEHGLGYFDGTHLYEHPDPRKGFHNDWQSLIFNYGRNEVRSFLISNALFWLDKYHIDGLRVDAVASMLYLDYSRNHGEWIPNEHGGREHLEAVSFLQELNEAVHLHHPGVITIAEESTAWPGVTRAVHEGGLGFDLKWMMGWMHDTLNYLQKEPIYRRHHQSEIAFSIHYTFSERFLLPLSHDEVVHGKRSLIHKMAGDDWQRFANLRLLYSYMYGHPGAKMLFMGAEFAQEHEWRHDSSLDWDENNRPMHRGIQTLVKELNALYYNEQALHEYNFTSDGFEWIDWNDADNSVLCWLRKSGDCRKDIVIAANFTPVVRENYRIGVPSMGYYKELFNSDDQKYGGSGVCNEPELETAPIPFHGRTHSLSLVLPPLGLIMLRYERAYDYLPVV